MDIRIVDLDVGNEEIVQQTAVYPPHAINDVAKTDFDLLNKFMVTAPLL